MPTYDYGCSACGHKFEAFQKITADPLTTCPSCGGAVQRIIGPGAGFIFKGSGFYITDHRSESYKKAAEKDKPAVSSKSKENKKGDKSTTTKD